MRTLTVLAAAITVALLIGCDAPDPTALGAGATPTSPALDTHGGSPSFKAHVEFVNLRRDEHIKMSVHGVRHSNGDITGEFEQHVDFESTGEFMRRAHGTVVCYAVEGETVRYGVTLDRSSGISAPPGAEIIGTLVDKGEPGDGDLASPTAPFSVVEHCTLGLARPLLPIIRGNVQVRD